MCVSRHFLAGLSEALGVNELSTALDSLRTAVESSLKGSGAVGARSKAELLNANSRLTEEVAQLRQQVKDLETRKVEAITQLKEEVRPPVDHRSIGHGMMMYTSFHEHRNCLCSNSSLSKGDTTARIHTSCIRSPLWRILFDRNERGKREHWLKSTA